MAALIFPLANPVHDIVIPLVGSSAARSNPSAISGWSWKNNLPIPKATNGMIAKLMNCVTI